MTTEELVRMWFEKWDSGDYRSLPLAENFAHTSPFGTITGKETYLELVAANEDKFLGNTIVLLDELYARDSACVRYHLEKDDFTLEVSEWFYTGPTGIEEIVAYYHIGEIREERRLK